ncbi:hypothetical protein SLEP1_g35790 [Rubroshorea leprosula]|uniref:Reverse transcriptase domain-containing protein n=1 Tax=Rubroshorea leprosula TaxID=152421 RepID=A0AAV5KPC2_9ROSI|nr:hypothetical protein SLEP1_g35790 [Rubroshorea leprosula]
MLGVQDVQYMEGRLNQIWFGSYKLRVKVAIDRGQNGTVYQKEADRKGRIRAQSFVKPGRSYVQAVKGYSSRAVGAQVWRKIAGVQERADLVDRASIAPGKPLGMENVRSGEEGGGAMDGESKESIIDFSPSKEENVWLEGGVVAVVRSMSMISNIQERVDIDGGLINLSPLGGRSVLLTERVEGYLSEYIQHNKESFDLWCEIIYPWALAPLIGGRMVWLRISGVPLQAWCDRCFERIAALVGEVIMIHADTKSKSILCDGRVLILCDEKHKISKTMKLKVEEKLYEIMVAEEEWRADPDWWLADDDRNGGTSSGSEYSSSEQGEEEPELMASVIRGDDEADIEDEGFGSLVKRREVSKLVRAERPDFLFLQETKLEMVEGALCKMLWFSDDYDWEMKESNGAFGGLLCIWNWFEFVKQGVISGNGFLRISGEWGPQKLKCNFVNVYASNDRQKKLTLWNDLRHMILEEEGRWMIAGDFNAVRCPSERKGRSGETQDMREFDDFVVSTGLVDIQLANRRFTWYRPDGSSMSRLDRVLMSGAMYSSGKGWVQHGLKRTVSDHCPIVVKTSVADWGPKPFRVLDAWQQHPQFKKVIEDKWKELVEEGYAGHRCKQKLKRLKDFLKGWNKEVFGNMETHFQQVVKSVEQIDLKNEVMDLAEEEVDLRKEGFQQLWDIMWKREAIWKQKSRSDWVKLGDQNTRYFHKIANGRKAHNSISGLWSDGQWVEDPEMVKDEMVKHFRNMFQEDDWNRPIPSNLEFRRISKDQKDWLERPFTEEEIDEGLKSCEGNKAPGPDGYNFNLLKFIWSSVREDFIAFFREFHQNSRLVRGLNSSFLTLIPKKLSPRELKDFRPISLIGCMYKLLAKVLANRLKEVMPVIISETQSAFVGGRQLVDSVLVLNEVVDEVRKRKQPAFVFKADFQKAYDCVNWSFLDWMSGAFGFGEKWRGWIKECLSTAWMSVLVNGSPTKEFEMGKGLRQGDPLSPFLFLMVGEALHGLVKKAENEGMLQGAKVGRRGLAVSLLQFADDTVILGEASKENILTVKAILRWFELMSGLRINFSKSCVYGFNTLDSWVRGAAGVLHCSVGKTPFVYLGMPVGGEKRKISWVKWEAICWSKEQGGLGVPDLRRRNWALLGKWWYRLGDGREGLWKRVVKEKFYEGKQEVGIIDVANLRVSQIWGDIIRIAINKEGSVKENGTWVGERWKWGIEWRRERMGREKDEENGLGVMLASIRLRKVVEDAWQWRYEVEGRYVVKTAYEYLAPEDRLLEKHLCKVIWCKMVPSKVGIFGWRLCLDRLPTRWNLRKRGVVLQEDGIVCGLCKEGVEDVNHLFCTCKEAWLVWVMVIKWWGVEVVMPDTVRGVVDLFLWSNGELKEQLLELIKVKSYFWIRNKVHGCVFPLAQWQSNPRECAKELKSYKRFLKLFTKQQQHLFPN